MAITRDVLRISEGLRVLLNAQVDATERDLIRAWGAAWAVLEPEWQQTITELVATAERDGWPSRVALAREERLIRALDATREALEQVVADAGARIVRDVGSVAADAAHAHAQMTAVQMPAVAGSQLELVVAFNRLSPAQLAAIVARTTQQITSTLVPLSAQSTAAVNAELVRGIAVGSSPRTAAARMVARVRAAVGTKDGAGFTGGLARALNVARTEMLDAHRAAAHQNDLANADVLEEWTWLATLDVTTCPSCWAKHGKSYPLTVPGPEDHQSGRCRRGPKVKSWRALGFDLDDPPDALTDARAKFAGLTQADQVRVMGGGPAGTERLRLLNAGDITWDDLSTKRTTPGWRDSYGVTPLKTLTDIAASRRTA